MFLDAQSFSKWHSKAVVSDIVFFLFVYLSFVHEVFPSAKVLLDVSTLAVFCGFESITGCSIDFLFGFLNQIMVREIKCFFLLVAKFFSLFLLG